jgi:two-component system cell cycle sensor histidine kinase/response regulator CckA
MPFLSVIAFFALRFEAAVDSGLVDLRALAGVIVAAALCAFPLILNRVLRRRADGPFPPVLRSLGGFMIAAGTAQLASVWALWRPDSWAAGWIEAAAAVVSAFAVVGLLRVVPQLLQLPSFAALKQSNEELEKRVALRTADLQAGNERLAREVQQREQAEAEVRRLNDSLQERVTEFQALFDLLPVGIVIAHDRECRTVRSNPAFAQMLRLAPDAGRSLSTPPMEAAAPFQVLEHGRELLLGQQPMQRAAAENVAVRAAELTVVLAGGRHVHVLVNAVPLRDANGAARGCVATYQDITAQKTATQDRLEFERRLQETQKLESLGVLAGGIAHDFNNLLTGVLGNASLARLELPPGYATVRTALDNLEQAALRAGDLCKQMLAYAGKGRFVVQPLSVSRMVRETAELLEVSISKKVSLELRLAEGLPAVNADAAQLRQILINLVVNASEAIGDRGGLVTIKTGRVRATREFFDQLVFSDQMEEGDYVYLEIADTGCGMDAATLARIFDPFFTTKFTGRGLGLAAVLGIVRGHKGAVKVRSEEGRGSTFTVLLPAIGAPATPPELLAQAVSEARSAGVILLVDDEETVRAVAAKILRSRGYDVVTAGDGAEALAVFSKQPGRFDLVLMDLTMPKMDGEETFRALRKEDASVRVMLMSGFDEQDTVKRFQGQGAVGFVPKPFTADVLLARVRQALAHPAAKIGR